MLEKHLLAKIARLKQKNQEKTAKNRKLRQRNKELEESRAGIKAKTKARKGHIVSKSRPCKLHHAIGDQSIAGHKFKVNEVDICLMLYLLGGCSLRGVKRVLLCLQLNYGFITFQSSCIPSKSSIDNWIQKVGYADYNQSNGRLYEDNYCVIIDESMVIGQQRMMVVLGMEAAKTTERATDMGCVRLLYMAVRATWKGSDVTDLMGKLIEKMGKPPLYVISDGGSTLKKGIADGNLMRICDVGHEIAKFVEQTYKNQEVFKSFSTDVSAVKFREIMKDTAYLLPPQQRSIARFMNIGDTVKWAKKISAVLPQLTQEEQRVFGFLKAYKCIIDELSDVVEMVNKVLKIIKNEGISYKNVQKSIFEIEQYKGKVPESLITKIGAYLKEEQEKLPDKTTIWHASSDVIESLFGKFKERSATNKLNGVTSLVLSLGLYGQFQEGNDTNKDKIKNALQDVSMADLKQWKRLYLLENQVVRRRKKLKK
jgi:hypothetical protein